MLFWLGLMGGGHEMIDHVALMQADARIMRVNESDMSQKLTLLPSNSAITCCLIMTSLRLHR